MTKREQLLQIVAAKIVGLPAVGVARVAVDGVDGAGKTTFADELADYLASGSRQIIRASVDGFHNPRALRYRLGATSPEGFFLDSYNNAGLAANLLRPLSPQGSRRFRRAIFDHRTDRPVVAPEEYADADAILLFDGIFLHRPELRSYWDFSIFLAVNFNVSICRCAERDAGSPDPLADANRRYVAGQQLYLAPCRPTALASLVVNNDDWENPSLCRYRVERGMRSGRLQHASPNGPYPPPNCKSNTYPNHNLRRFDWADVWLDRTAHNLLTASEQAPTERVCRCPLPVESQCRFRVVQILPR